MNECSKYRIVKHTQPVQRGKRLGNEGNPNTLYLVQLKGMEKVTRTDMNELYINKNSPKKMDVLDF